jgi:hypothetical protein
MKLVQEAVNRRRHEHADCDEKYDAREEGIERSEEFSTGCMEHIDWPHPAENHRGVQESIQPRHMLERAVAEYADEKRNRDEYEREEREARHAA